MRKISALLLTGCMMLSLGGCGSSAMKEMESADSMSVGSDFNYSAEYDAVTEDMGGGYYSENAEMKEETDWDDASSGSTAEQTNILSERKLIKTVDLNVETKAFDEVMSTLEKQVVAMGGYIENMETYNGSTYSGYRSERNASMTIRIPKDKLDAFLNTVSDISNVVRRSENVDDVTLAYVDTESRRNALRTEQERLLELLAVAQSIDEIIMIEDRLSDVRYELESMESQLRTYDNKVDYSTVYLYVDEVKELTPVNEETVWQRIGGGFGESLKDIGNGFVELVIWFAVNLPYLAMGAVLILAVVWGIKKLSKKANVRIQNETQNGTQDEIK